MDSDPLFVTFVVTGIVACLAVLGWLMARLIAVVIGALNVGQ